VPGIDTPSAARAGETHDWVADYAALSAADREHGLPPEELEQLAVAAFLLGHDDEVVTLRERAHQLYLDQGRIEEAVLCACWLGFHLQNRGEVAQAAGWDARIGRLVGDDPDGRFEAWRLAPHAVGAMWVGEAATALPMFERMAEVSSARGEIDLFVLSGIGRGTCLAMLDRPRESAAAVDEALLHVAARRTVPQVAGMAYCAAIGLCMERFDLRRAQEWTQALSAWIEEQAGLVPFRGWCMVHRAEIMQMRGDWPQAAEEAERACTWLSGALAGGAHYRIAELARLRGRLDLAEREYQQAAADGAEVQPGLARLRLAQGRPAAAAAGLERALAESESNISTPRGPLMAARIDVALGTGDVAGARAWLDRLTEYVGPDRAPYLRALSDHCQGVVLLAEGNARAALPRLRRAAALWQEVDAPYEGAHTRLAVARVCDALGDADAAQMDRESARATLAELGAAADLAALAALDGAPNHPLSPRELEVLRLLATGATNRRIADQLVLSEKTVARHVSNIFGKLEVPSRAAATAYAYEHGLA
jgi:ATP/maltotriose-dependent transcriptional regulator MalT